jgi:plasmid stability protein
MSQLIVRQLKPGLVRALKARAVRHGRSAEAEHRTILEAALRDGPPAGDFKAFLLAMPAGSEFRIHRSRDRGRPVKL